MIYNQPNRSRLANGPGPYFPEKRSKVERNFSFSKLSKEGKKKSKLDKENNSTQHNMNPNLMKMYKKEMHSMDHFVSLESQKHAFSSSFSFNDFKHPKNFGIVPHKNLEGKDLTLFLNLVICTPKITLIFNNYMLSKFLLNLHNKLICVLFKSL